MHACTTVLPCSTPTQEDLEARKDDNSSDTHYAPCDRPAWALRLPFIHLFIRRLHSSCTTLQHAKIGYHPHGLDKGQPPSVCCTLHTQLHRLPLSLLMITFSCSFSSCNLFGSAALHSPFTQRPLYLALICMQRCMLPHMLRACIEDYGRVRVSLVRVRARVENNTTVNSPIVWNRFVRQGDLFCILLSPQ